MVLQSSFFFISVSLSSGLEFWFSATCPSNNSPSPSPESGGAPAGGPATDFYSPPSPSPSDLVPTSPPSTSAPSPITSSSPSSSPSPSPSPSSDINQGTDNDETADSKGSSSGGGLKGEQKAGITGITIAVIVDACIVGEVDIIYKKRQKNIRRQQYGYTIRREIL